MKKNKKKKKNEFNHMCFYCKFRILGEFTLKLLDYIIY